MNGSMLGGGGGGFKVPALQADAVLDQAAPVQNTYYTVLATTKNVRVTDVIVWVNTTGETIDGRMTVDGNTVPINGAALPADVSGTTTRNNNYNNGNLRFLQTGQNYPFAFAMEGRSVKIEIRKTTAAGAGNLHGVVVYGKW